jgi:hypothetical protein
MQNLQSLISQLESKIIHFKTTNLAISEGSVGWHIEHSLKTIDQIVTGCKNSNPVNYKWSFNFKRVLIMGIIKKIPRGKAKAPKIVRSDGAISSDSLQLSLQKVKENLIDWNQLEKNAHFSHPFFGVLNKKETEDFLVLHTKDHLMIIDDVLKLN